MMVGLLYYLPPQAAQPRDIAMEWVLTNSRILRHTDDKQMGRLYLVPQDNFSSIPGFLEQGPPIRLPRTLSLIAF